MSYSNNTVNTSYADGHFITLRTTCTMYGAGYLTITLA